MSVKYHEKVYFGSIPVGTEATRTFPIKNGAKHTNWSVVQHPGFDIALNAFTVKKKINKLEEHAIIIHYKPLQPNQKHVNYYLIKNIAEHDIVLYVTGFCEGLSVQSTVKYINFYRLKTDFRTKTVFELRNNSICNVLFQFDINNQQNIFRIEPEIGEILAGKYVYITAQFITTKNGIFFMDLPCLIQHHQPIYIELLGVKSPETIEKHLRQLKGQCSKISLVNGFEKYMTETFDFSLKNSQICQSTEIYNYTERCVQVLWDLDPNSDVTVFPQKFFIRSDERNFIETKFEPKALERFSGGQIYGRVFIFGDKNDQEDPETVILPISMRYIGSSFMKTVNWTPSVQIFPHSIVMPVCIENKSVYSTFYIKKIGVYPVTFKILAPKKSHFRVEPSVGLIKDSFQLFIVKFSSGDTKNGVFKEKWSIEFNQKVCVHSEIYLKAHVQEPKLLIAENDQLDFGIVFPGCKKYLQVPVINKTQNTIKFLFQNNKWFTVEPSEGLIESFGTTDLLWCFTADCDVESKTEFLYEIRVVQESVVILGAPYIGSVHIFAKCAYGKICASPTSYDFRSVVCGEPVSTSFTLHNFSEVSLHFLLKIHNHFGLSKEKAVTVNPLKGSIAPGDHLEVTIKVLTYWSTLSTYCIQLLLREHADSDVLVDTKGQTFSTIEPIFRLDYYSFYPTLKFMEIALNTTGPLFGKLNVWEYFATDGFNEILRTIRINEVKRYSVRIPDAEAGLDITKTITFIVKNVTREDTTCRFERKKICDCELKEVKNSPGLGTFRKYTYDDCPHRKLISISTSDEVVKAYTIMYVTIQIHYLLHGRQEVCYLMHLSHNRTVEVYFEVIGLKSAQLSTYSHGFTLEMNSTFIGELCPDLQIFWFLNNTRTSARYKLDVEPLQRLNKYWSHPVLTCVNPEGYIDAKSIDYIEFLFAPVAAGQIDLELPFEFGSKVTTLRVVGHALPYFTSPLERNYYTELGKEYYKVPGLMINISTEHIVLRAFPTHCSTTRILTLKNVTDSKTIGFMFDNYSLEGIITVSMKPSSGLLQPGERVALILTVETGGVACALRVSVNCHLVDHTALQKHLSTTAEYHKQIDARNDQFCISDNGVVTYPAVPTVEVTPAPKVFHRTVAVTTHIIPQLDLDTKMTIQDQLKQTPFKDLPIYQPSRLSRFLIPRPQPIGEVPSQPEKSKQPIREAGLKKKWKCTRNCCVTFSDEEYVAVHTVLSCLLNDFLFSKEFKHLIRVMSKRPERYYSEFCPQQLTVDEEVKMVQLVVNKIPNSLLSEVMQTMLADCLLKQFRLGHYPHDDAECDRIERLLKTSSLSFGKTLYSEKFLFLLDHV